MTASGSWRLNTYVLVCTGLCAFTLFSLRGQMPMPGWEFGLFFLLVLAAEALPVDLPRYRGTISVSFVVIYTSVLVLGPGLGMIIAALGTLSRKEITGSSVLRRCAFNRAQLGLAAACSGLVFMALGGSPGYIEVGQDLIPLVAGGLTYMVVNFGLVAIYLSLHLEAPVSHVWASELRWSIPHSLALLPVAFLLAAVYHSVGVLGMVFFLFPLLVGRYSYTMYSEMRAMFLSTIKALAAALEAKDPYTHGHADRVAKLAVRLARELKLPEPDVEMLAYVGTLHDVGKIGVHDAILKKPGLFAKDEFEEMKLHPVMGAHIVKDIKAMSRGADWILHHHEHYNGMGYPGGLSGEQIPLGARIIAVADAFDAIVSGRPYRPARGVEEACREIIRCAGRQFDPEIAEVMVRLSREKDFVDDVFGDSLVDPDPEEEELWASSMAEAASEAAAADDDRSPVR